MPKQSVYKYTCDRCGRTWYPEVKPDEPTPETKSLQLKLMGRDGTPVVDVSYDVLCESCEKTVGNYVEGLAKDLKKNSPKRGAKKSPAGVRGDGAPRSSSAGQSTT